MDKIAYTQEKNGRLFISVIKDANPRVDLRLDLGILNEDFSLSFPFPINDPAATSQLVNKALEALLESVRVFLLDHLFKEDLVYELFAAVYEAVQKELEESISATLETIQVYEIFVPLPDGFHLSSKDAVTQKIASDSYYRKLCEAWIDERFRTAESFKAYIDDWNSSDRSVIGYMREFPDLMGLLEFYLFKYRQIIIDFDPVSEGVFFPKLVNELVWTLHLAPPLAIMNYRFQQIVDFGERVIRINYLNPRCNKLFGYIKRTYKTKEAFMEEAKKTVARGLIGVNTHSFLLNADIISDRVWGKAKTASKFIAARNPAPKDSWLEIIESSPTTIRFKIFSDASIREFEEEERNYWLNLAKKFAPGSKQYKEYIELSEEKVDPSPIAQGNAEPWRTNPNYVKFHSQAQKGYGPLLYDAAMMYLTSKGKWMTPAAAGGGGTSPAAEAVWKHYYFNRPDVQKKDISEEQSEMPSYLKENIQGKPWLQTVYQLHGNIESLIPIRDSIGKVATPLKSKTVAKEFIERVFANEAAFLEAMVDHNNTRLVWDNDDYLIPYRAIIEAYLFKYRELIVKWDPCAHGCYFPPMVNALLLSSVKASVPLRLLNYNFQHMVDIAHLIENEPEIYNPYFRKVLGYIKQTYKSPEKFIEAAHKYPQEIIRDETAKQFLEKVDFLAKVIWKDEHRKQANSMSFKEFVEECLSTRQKFLANCWSGDIVKHLKKFTPEQVALVDSYLRLYTPEILKIPREGYYLPSMVFQCVAMHGCSLPLKAYIHDRNLLYNWVADKFREYSERASEYHFVDAQKVLAWIRRNYTPEEFFKLGPPSSRYMDEISWIWKGYEKNAAVVSPAKEFYERMEKQKLDRIRKDRDTKLDAEKTITKFKNNIYKSRPGPLYMLLYDRHGNPKGTARMTNRGWVKVLDKKGSISSRDKIQLDNYFKNNPENED